MQEIAQIIISNSNTKHLDQYSVVPDVLLGSGGGSSHLLTASTIKNSRNIIAHPVDFILEETDKKQSQGQ